MSAERFNQFFSSTFAFVFFISYFGSLPLAIIFGDKWDVVLSIFIPTYGFFVMLGAFL